MSNCCNCILSSCTTFSLASFLYLSWSSLDSSSSLRAFISSTLANTYILAFCSSWIDRSNLFLLFSMYLFCSINSLVSFSIFMNSSSAWAFYIAVASLSNSILSDTSTVFCKYQLVCFFNWSMSWACHTLLI